MVLLATVTAVSLAVAGLFFAIEPEQAPRQAEASKPADVADRMQVRVIGTPFVPNTNPRER